MATDNTTSKKVWLSIPFKQKEIAKSTIGKLPDGRPGIAWDKVQKCGGLLPPRSLKNIIIGSSLKPWLFSLVNKRCLNLWSDTVLMNLTIAKELPVERAPPHNTV